MKSLSYMILRKKPRNRDDCMDYLKHQDSTQKPEVSLVLSVKERVGCDFTLISFYADYEWTFPDGLKCTFPRVYGGVCDYESPRRYQRMQQQAVRRLQKDLDWFGEAGIPYYLEADKEDNWQNSPFSRRAVPDQG